MDEIARKIDRIEWGKSIVHVGGRFTEPQTFILRSLTNEETNFVNHIYDRVLVDSIQSGIMTDEELKEFYEEHDIWTERDDAELRNLKRQVDLIKSQIKDAEYFPVKQKQLQKKLDKIETQIIVKRQSRTNLFNCSADTRAAEISRRFMVSMSTETRDGRPYWPEEADFLGEVDVELIYNVAIAYFENNMYPEAELREIARSGQWRFKWNASKNGMDLFGRPISEWSEMQDALVYWSQFYDFVFDNPDRPNEAIIHDDASCDAWVDDKMKENRLGRQKTKTKKPGLISPRKGRQTGARQEIFTMVERGDQDTVERVQDMNTSAVRKRLQEENKRIKESKGRVPEWKLRGREYLQTLER